MADGNVQLAHAIVRYLGIDGPDGLASFEIDGIGGLVDLISKVILISLPSAALAAPSNHTIYVRQF